MLTSTNGGLFTALESFLSVSRIREVNATVPVAEETLVKLEGYLHVLFTVLTTLREESREFKTISKNMHQCLATAGCTNSKCRHSFWTSCVLFLL